MSVLCVILEEADLLTIMDARTRIIGNSGHPVPVDSDPCADRTGASGAGSCPPHGDQDNQQGRHRHPEQQYKKIRLRCGHFESIFYCPYIDLAIN